MIEAFGGFIDLTIRDNRKVIFSGEVLTDEPVSVLVQNALPGGLWMSKKESSVKTSRQLHMTGELIDNGVS